MEARRLEGSSAGYSGHKMELLERRLQGNSNGASDLMKALRFDEPQIQVSCRFLRASPSYLNEGQEEYSSAESPKLKEPLLCYPVSKSVSRQYFCLFRRLF